MALGLIVKTGRILTAKLLLGQAVDGITHCAIRWWAGRTLTFKKACQRSCRRSREKMSRMSSKSV